MFRLLALGAVLVSIPLARPVWGQGPTGTGGVITGVVRAGQGAPVAFATVALRRTADTVRAGETLTDSAGTFRLQRVAAGRYQVEVRRLGFRMATRTGVTVTTGVDRIDLGVIRLEASAVALQEVAVTAARPAVAVLPDRNVYSTSRMPIAAGGMATDVLRSVPELQVSVEGSVTARGATPRIYINGRPAPMQGEALDRYLQQLPAERIDRVEVIANPSARYEADGQGGIVNIVMKRGEVVGLSGSLAVNAATRNQQGGSGSLNLQRGRLSAFGSASASFFGNSTANSDLRQNLRVQPATFVQQDSRSRNSGGSANLNLGTELQTGSRGTLWMDLGAGRSPSHLDALSAYTLLDALGVPTERYDRVNDMDRRGLFSSLAAGYRDVARGHGGEWSVELRRNVNTSDRTDESARHRLSPSGTADALDLAPELTVAGQGEGQRGLSAEANVTRSWGGSGQVEVGYRGSLRNTGDDFRSRVDATENPDAAVEEVGDFRQRERIHAGYVSVGRKLGRLQVQGGVRGERAEVRRTLPLSGQTFASTYRNLFPNALVSTEFGTGRQLSLSYSRRVDRPWGAVINPAIPILDPLNRRVGNPSLMPRYTDALSLTVTSMGRLGMLQLSPYYTRTVDGWDQVRTVDETGVSTVTWQNLATTSSYGGSISASLSPVGRVSGLLNVSAYREVRDASNLQADFSGASTQLSAMSTLSVRATSALSVQGFATYIPARTVPQGRVSALVFSTIGLRQRLWRQRGAINLSVVDPFELQRFTFTTRDRTHVQTGRSTISARRAMLGVSYNFGKPPQRRGRGKAEETKPESEAPVIR